MAVKSPAAIARRRAWKKRYMAKYDRARSPESVRRQVACRDARMREVREEVARRKAEPCVDCGGRFPSECMDFDHVRGGKAFNVSSATGRGNPTRILAEMAKCEVVCANCHRTRTRRRLEGAE